jgi:hypothetical protein
MILCPELSLAVLTTPRSANVSIACALAPWVQPRQMPDWHRSLVDHLFAVDLPASERAAALKADHTLAQMFLGACDTPRPLSSLDPECLVVAVLRSPYERIASMWSARGRASGRQPREFLATSQRRALTDPLAGLDESPNEVRVLRWESLDADWTALARDLGVDAPLPHLCRSMAGESAVRAFFGDDAIRRDVAVRVGKAGGSRWSAPWEETVETPEPQPGDDEVPTAELEPVSWGEYDNDETEERT